MLHFVEGIDLVGIAGNHVVHVAEAGGDGVVAHGAEHHPVKLRRLALVALKALVDHIVARVKLGHLVHAAADGHLPEIVVVQLEGIHVLQAVLGQDGELAEDGQERGGGPRELEGDDVAVNRDAADFLRLAGSPLGGALQVGEGRGIDGVERSRLQGRLDAPLDVLCGNGFHVMPEDVVLQRDLDGQVVVGDRVGGRKVGREVRQRRVGQKQAAEDERLEQVSAVDPHGVQLRRDGVAGGDQVEHLFLLRACEGKRGQQQDDGQRHAQHSRKFLHGKASFLSAVLIFMEMNSILPRFLPLLPEEAPKQTSLWLICSMNCRYFAVENYTIKCLYYNVNSVFEYFGVKILQFDRRVRLFIDGRVVFVLQIVFSA